MLPAMFEFPLAKSVPVEQSTLPVTVAPFKTQSPVHTTPSLMGPERSPLQLIAELKWLHPTKMTVTTNIVANLKYILTVKMLVTILYQLVYKTLKAT